MRRGENLARCLTRGSCHRLLERTGDILSMSILKTLFLCTLPSVYGFQRRVIQDDAKLREHRFETVLRERGGFLQEHDRNPRKQDGRESAHSASSRNRSKGEAPREDTNHTKLANGASPRLQQRVPPQRVSRTSSFAGNVINVVI